MEKSKKDRIKTLLNVILSIGMTSLGIWEIFRPYELENYRSTSNGAFFIALGLVYLISCFLKNKKIAYLSGLAILALGLIFYFNYLRPKEDKLWNEYMEEMRHSKDSI